MAPQALRLLLLLVLVSFLIKPAHAFGAGNIASISKIEGRNWRHGDIEDMLKTVAFIRGHKWTSMMIKRAYFGNWLRDYSQAVDVGTLKGVPADTIRILIWVLAFMSFGYATAEFEVTSERLGTYRPEEHIDNPKDYADNIDARQYDERLRPPVMPEELAVDPNTGMKAYIADERGGWATSSGFIKHSFTRSIHFGRMYTAGPHGQRGNEENLCEALRCLGQGLHTLEDFGAHTNYTELALREMGFRNVFPHTGVATQINLRGNQVFPLVTGTFGGVDFLHSVLGEATDHFTQSEVDEMNDALGQAADPKNGGRLQQLTDVLSKVPGTGHLVQQAQHLQSMSSAQAMTNAASSKFSSAIHHGFGFRGVGGEETARADQPYMGQSQFGQSSQQYDGQNQQQYGQQQYDQQPQGQQGQSQTQNAPGTTAQIDPQAVIAKIYPILQFRDTVVRAISHIVEKIPGLEHLIDTITERVTLFVMSLLAPFIQPVIEAAAAQLKVGSSTVVNASGKHQYEPWTDPHCTDPTHSLLSKDHFSNILNEPAGQIASAILQYVAPRVIYAWENPWVPVDEVMNDIVRVFHHPAVRDMNLEIHRNMFHAVERWVHAVPERAGRLDQILSADSVREGHNHTVPNAALNEVLAAGQNQVNQQLHSHALPNFGRRDGEPDGGAPADYNYQQSSQQQHHEPPPASFRPNDPTAYSTAYQQGYENTG